MTNIYVCIISLFSATSEKKKKGFFQQAGWLLISQLLGYDSKRSTQTPALILSTVIEMMK